MSTNKLTETLDTISDKAFGFNKASSESATEVHETVPATHYEDRTETLNTSHADTAAYPIAEHPVAEQPTAEYQTEHFDPETDPASQQEEPVCEKPFIPNQQPFTRNHNHVPDAPANPPFQHQHAQGHKPELKTGPEQDFTVATVAGFMGVLSLLLMFSNPALGLLAIIFGATAVYFGRRTERAGIGAGIGKTLGWFSFFGGIIALFAAAFFLFVAFVYVMIR